MRAGAKKSHCGRVNGHAKPRAGAGTRAAGIARNPHSRPRTAAWTQGRRPSRATKGQDSPPTAPQKRLRGAAAQLADRRSLMWVLPSLDAPARRREQQQAPTVGMPARCHRPTAPASAAGTPIQYAPETRSSQPPICNRSVTESYRQSDRVLYVPPEYSPVPCGRTESAEVPRCRSRGGRPISPCKPGRDPSRPLDVCRKAIAGRNSSTKPVIRRSNQYVRAAGGQCARELARCPWLV
ncbi:hypothetical protein SAMN04489832_2420 [Micromonospora cremea]|uniref:Uncharacterized protein n=1 Tax=Micromonospora cremea TaxID=709881 RepID=A0A1N5WHR2_9ACTN|nr:hypothetical protein SAMN04489832_2420 [Micromonospora cremea]